MAKGKNHLGACFYNGLDYRQTMTTKELKETLLETDGFVSIQGQMCELKTKSLGAGVYRVWAEPIKEKSDWLTKRRST